MGTINDAARAFYSAALGTNIGTVNDLEKAFFEAYPGGVSSRTPDWITARSYAVGELVVSAGVLYRTTTAHTSAGAFDGTKFTAIGGGSGGGSIQGIFGAGAIGSWYPVVGIPINAQGNQAMGAAGTANVGTPFIAQENMTIDALGCYVGTAAAGGTVRLGLLTPRMTNPYRIALASIYADLLVESAAPIDVSTVGMKTALLTTPIIISAGAAFAGISVVQGSAAVSLWSENNSTLNNTPWGQSGDLIENGNRLSVQAAGINGALPATFTPTAWRPNGVGGCTWFRRSA